jgi:hypothetical protein
MNNFVYMDNFRGFQDEVVLLKQVNFLVGENSTGKSSFIELLKTLCYPLFWLHNPEFTNEQAVERRFHDLVSASSKKRRSFTIGAVGPTSQRDSSPLGIFVTYTNKESRPSPRRVTLVGKEVITTLEGGIDTIMKKGERVKVRNKPTGDVFNSSDPKNAIRKLAQIHSSNSALLDEELEEYLYPRVLLSRYQNLAGASRESGNKRGISAPSFFLRDLIEIAPIRSKPRRTYDAPQTDYSPEGDHIPYLIKKKLGSATGGKAFEYLMKQIGIDSGLFESIKVKSYGRDAYAPFELKITLGGAVLGLENVGYGVSQALPVIVEMFNIVRSSILTIQQPEVHLHPKAQASIGDLVANGSRKEGSAFFIETHSDFLIDRFRLNVRINSAIESQLLFFERTNSGNSVSSIDIQADGSLAADQPASYRDFFFNEAISLLD